MYTYTHAVRKTLCSRCA